MGSKKTKLMLGMLVVFCLVLLVASPAFANPSKGSNCTSCHSTSESSDLPNMDFPGKGFSDVGGSHWAKNYIQEMASRGILLGYGNGKFGPEDKLIEDHFRLIFERAGLPVTVNNAPAQLTREKAAWYLIRALKLENEAKALSDADRNSILGQFKDAGKIDPGYKGSVALAVKKGILVGYAVKDKNYGVQTKEFRPKEVLTRAQIVTVLARQKAKRVEDAGYIGSKKCASCHEGKYNAWKETGHANMILPWSEAVEKYDIRKANLDLSKVKFVIAGHYIVDLNFNRTYAWNEKTKSWDPSSGAWSGCAQCHTTGFIAKDKDGNNIVTEDISLNNKAMKGASWAFKEYGIGCEACHGPGRDHAKTGDPSKIVSSVSSSVCEKCHAKERQAYALNRRMDPSNGTWNYDKKADGTYKGNHGYSLSAIKAFGSTECLLCHSQDYRDSKIGSAPTISTAQFGITCVTCHSPHKKTEYGRQLRKEQNELCFGCHNGEGSVEAGNTEVHHPQEEMFKATLSETDFGVAPIPSPKGEIECAECHMKGEITGYNTANPSWKSWASRYPVGTESVTHFFKALVPGAKVVGGHAEQITVDACKKCHGTSMSESRLASYQNAVQERINALNPILNTLTPKNQTLVKFIDADGSKGVHNYPYVKAILQQIDNEEAGVDFSALPALP